MSKVASAGINAASTGLNVGRFGSKFKKKSSSKSAMKGSSMMIKTIKAEKHLTSV